MKSKQVIALLITVLIGLSSAPPAHASGEGGDWVQETGDILQIALPAGAGLMTLFANPDPDAMWDREGTRQCAWTFGTAWTSTYILKIIAGKERPNGANLSSWPHESRGDRMIGETSAKAELADNHINITTPLISRADQHH